MTPYSAKIFFIFIVAAILIWGLLLTALGFWMIAHQNQFMFFSLRLSYDGDMRLTQKVIEAVPKVTIIWGPILTLFSLLAFIIIELPNRTMETFINKIENSSIARFIKRYPLLFLVTLLVLTNLVMWYGALNKFFSVDDFVSFRDAKYVPYGFNRDVLHFGMLYYSLNRFLFGLNPFGYHAMSLFFHILNTTILFYFIRILIERNSVAFLTSFLYATRSALYGSIYQFTDLNKLGVTLFGLLSVLFFLKNEIQDKKIFYVISLICAIFASRFRQDAVYIPIILLTLSILLSYNSDKFVLTCYRSFKKVSIFLLFLLLDIYLFRNFYWTTTFSKIEQGSTFSGIFFKLPRYIFWSFFGILFPALNRWTDLINKFIIPSIGSAIWLILILYLMILISIKCLKYQRYDKLFLLDDFLYRRTFIFGMVWFFLTIAPHCLGDRFHFRQGYLTFPLIGWAIFISILIINYYDKLKVNHKIIAKTFLILFLIAIFLFSKFEVSLKDAGILYYDLSNSVAHAHHSRTILEDIKISHPTFPPDSTIYLVNYYDETRVYIGHSGRKGFYGVSEDMIPLFYDDDSLRVRYIFTDFTDEQYQETKKYQPSVVNRKAFQDDHSENKFIYFYEKGHLKEIKTRDLKFH